MVDLKDEYRWLVGAYYGISTMDEYELKVYVLKDLENYIKDFVLTYPIKNFDYEEEAIKINNELPLITKLQDSLLFLNRENEPMELILLVKAKIKQLKKENIK